MIRWFKDVGSDHLALVGGKGANLGECATAGFPVPPGFIIDTSAYTTATESIQAELIAAVDKQDIEQAQQLVRRVTIPADLRAEVEKAYAGLGDRARVAVRSSATAEDLAEASFAGQQDSYLGITGVDALWDAVRRCWASLWNERAVSYRRKHGVPSEGLALAVVVQTMISSDVSGVLFTRNPMADNTDMMISAAYGLGESVVAALVTPDTFTVTREPVTVVSQTIGSKETRIDMADGAATYNHGQYHQGTRHSLALMNRRSSSWWRWASWSRNITTHRRILNGPSLTASCTCCRPGRSPRSRTRRAWRGIHLRGVGLSARFGMT